MRARVAVQQAADAGDLSFVHLGRARAGSRRRRSDLVARCLFRRWGRRPGTGVPELSVRITKRSWSVTAWTPVVPETIGSSLADDSTTSSHGTESPGSGTPGPDNLALGVEA